MLFPGHARRLIPTSTISSFIDIPDIDPHQNIHGLPAHNSPQYPQLTLQSLSNARKDAKRAEEYSREGDYGESG